MALTEHFNTEKYESLMRRRICKILLICSSYDGFVLEEDGRIETRISQEYNELNLSNPPVIKRMESAVAALKLLETENDFDLIITMYNVGDMDPFRFSKSVKKMCPEIPIVLLASYSRLVHSKISGSDTSSLDYIYYWSGSMDLIIAIIKLVEDRMNADHDIFNVGVQAILLVEDNIRYYSTYLPAIYRIVLRQSSDVREALNEQQQKLCKRVRPKILMASNYTDAVELYQKYRENLLGVISDVGFVVNKGDAPESEKLDAGIELCRMIKSNDPQMPFLLQSSQKDMGIIARELGVGFLVKNSKTLLIELSDYISSEFGFGDLVFKDPETRVTIGRAGDLRELQRLLPEVPDDVLQACTSRNLLSKWMLSRGLFSLGEEFKRLTADHFGSVDEMRQFILDRILEYRMSMGHGIVAKFNDRTYDETIWFARMGEGSLGGKGRGLAFLNRMLHKHATQDKYERVDVAIPRTVVIATDYFDEFIADNGLKSVINSDMTDDEILSEFVSSTLPAALVESLKVYIAHAAGPLAIRSSSKLEDSYYQPFAGIYSTYMIPFVEPAHMYRLLAKAIKSVYASVYFSAARSYITATSNVISEEKMAVVIQEVCGSEQDGFFYPTLSGVGRSLNFYPLGDERPEDGVVKIAYGLGKAVVEGEKVLQFSPKYPRKVLQLSTSELALRDTQRRFYALNLKPEEFKISKDDAVNIARKNINDAKTDRNMRYAASTWDPQSGYLSDSAMAEGYKVITFAPILKYDMMPLAQILSDLLKVFQEEMHCCIEMEFAVDMDVPEGEKYRFNLLQIRPIADETDGMHFDWDSLERDECMLYSENALGTGEVSDVCDVVYVKQSAFDTSKTEQIATEVAVMNEKLRKEGRGYMLIGPGRWGSSDPWLGVPVNWAHISEVRVVVECGLDNFRVEPSQGTHFFQNMTAFGVGYLNLAPYDGTDIYKEELLNALPAVNETDYVRHVRLERPIEIVIDGINNKGYAKL